jgi:hypothetical protein
MRPPSESEREFVAIELLRARGAGEMAHPGGTVLAHLRRVHTTLQRWGAGPTLGLAGLCHAWYGTDGFAETLGDVSHREELATAIGPDAERLVYLYAGCDRHFTYPRLSDRSGLFRDRFTGAEFSPTPSQRRDCAELTAANELDIMQTSAALRVQHGADLHALFTNWRKLLSDPAWLAVHTELT